MHATVYETQYEQHCWLEREELSGIFGDKNARFAGRQIGILINEHYEPPE
jgi:hypothetical protein